MVQNKCSNFLICKQFINMNINELYCKDCLFNFNYSFVLKNNINKQLDENLICPLCLNSPKLFVKQKSCDHYICSECIYNIYFDKSYIKNMPQNPVTKIKKSWDLYIYGNQSYKFKNKVLNVFYNYEFDDEIYDSIIEANAYYIPNLFKKDLRKLVIYQLLKNKYISNYHENKYKKINTIKTCPYCRKKEL